MKSISDQKAAKADDTPNTSPEDRAWRLAQLAALLAPKTFVTAAKSDAGTLKIIHSRSPEREILTILNHETAFEILLDQADYLLHAAERRSHLQHAYHLFRTGKKFLAVDAIANTFKRHRWRGLTSHSNTDDLLTLVLRELKKIEKGSKANAIAKEFPNLASIPSVTENPLWVSIDQLVEKGGRDGSGRATKYWAERIFQLAHLACREKFKDRLERYVE